MGALFIFFRIFVCEIIDILENGAYQCVHYGKVYSIYEEIIAKIKIRWFLFFFNLRMKQNFIQDQVFNQNDDLANAEYENCVFNNCDFANKDLSEFKFVECEFNHCNLSLAKLNNTAFQDIKFNDCKMLGLDFFACNQFGLSFSFDRCQLNHASFYKTNIRKTVFKKSQLRAIDFAETDLTDAVFDDCDLEQTVFDRSTLEKTDFRTAYNYAFDPEINRIKKAKFSMAGIAGLLKKYNITIEP